MGSFHLPSRKVRSRLKGAAVAVALAVVVLEVTTIKPGGHVTECGVDAKGPYAKVRVNNYVGGRVNGESVNVGFTYDGHPYGGNDKDSSTTTFVQGTWPPSVIDLDFDGGPSGRVPVPGRVAGGHWVNTGKGLPPGVKPKFKALVEPYDTSLLGCKVYPSSDE